MLLRLHTLIRDTLRKNKGGTITPALITEAVNSASVDLWRELVKDFRDTGLPNELLVPFKGKSLISASSNSATLSGKAGAAITGVSVIISGKEYEALLLHSDLEWSKRNTINRESPYLIKRKTYEHTVTQPLPLPDDFLAHQNVLIWTNGTNEYEGIILEANKFSDRINSTFLAPDSENPVATIYDGAIKAQPALSASQSYILPYKAYKSDRVPFARYEPSGSNMTIEIDEVSDGSSNVIVFYYNTPTTATATYAQTNGIWTPTVTTDLDWGADAFPLIARRALTHLGVPLNNPAAMQLESITKQIDG